LSAIITPIKQYVVQCDGEHSHARNWQLPVNAVQELGNLEQQHDGGPVVMPATPIIGSNPEYEKVASYPAFDWLRFILASVVVLGHEGLEIRPLHGALAVDVFFALSGWLIGGILLETARSELPRFFFNRATRIWIPYAAAIGLLYGFAAVYQGVSLFWAKYLFFDLTFTHQLFTHFPRASHELPLGGSGNQFWSISVEEQFYLVAPLIMLLPFGRKLPLWIGIAVLLMAGGVLGEPIALGVIAAILRRDFGDWHRGSLARSALIAATLGVLAALFFYDIPPLRALFAMGVVLSLAVPGKRRILPVFLGGISYPLYLNHWVGAFVGHGITRHVFHMADGTFTTTAVLITFAYPASLLTGAIAYCLVDRQVLARRSQWFSRVRGLTCAAAGYTLVVTGIVGGLLIG
jgi:peptidoglycan/LPS O-acetylase OafA/YrhL